MSPPILVASETGSVMQLLGDANWWMPRWLQKRCRTSAPDLPPPCPRQFLMLSPPALAEAGLTAWQPNHSSGRSGRLIIIRKPAVQPSHPAQATTKEGQHVTAGNGHHAGRR